MQYSQYSSGSADQQSVLFVRFDSYGYFECDLKKKKERKGKKKRKKAKFFIFLFFVPQKNDSLMLSRVSKLLFFSFFFLD